MAIPLAAQQPHGARPVPSPVRSAASPVRTFQVGGTVIHALGGGPLAGVDLSLAPIGKGGDSKSTDAQTSVSDANGRFLFTGVAAGKYVLSGRRHGFPLQQLDAHGSLFTAVVVGPEKNSENLVFRLRPEGSISGRITDEQGEA